MWVVTGTCQVPLWVIVTRLSDSVTGFWRSAWIKTCTRNTPFDCSGSNSTRIGKSYTAATLNKYHGIFEHNLYTVNTVKDHQHQHHQKPHWQGRKNNTPHRLHLLFSQDTEVGLSALTVLLIIWAKKLYPKVPRMILYPNVLWHGKNLGS